MSLDSAARPTAAVIGGGPAGLMAAEVLAARGVAVTVYDRMPTVGRKFLMAGRGGLNITHGEPLDAFLTRYGNADPRLAAAVTRFPPAALRDWCHDLGQPTVVGSSGRVFPAAMKATPLLRAWLRRLAETDVVVRPRHRWTGWSADGALRFDTPAGEVRARPDATVLALGGASWPHLGSDGGWVPFLTGLGLAVSPLQPANAGLRVRWSDPFRARFEGTPVKNVRVRIGAATARGDLVVTRSGLEGGPVYGLSARLRAALADGGPATLHVALRPDLSTEAVVAKLTGRVAKQSVAKQSVATLLRKRLHLAPVAIGLLQEAAHAQGRPLGAFAALDMARLIGAVPLPVEGLAGLDRAISTAGGLAFADLDPAGMLRGRPGVFAAGEMLDWEAPTGGYLLQACFATGVAAGEGALAFLGSNLR